MDVYLVPVGTDQHELYTEVPDDPPDEAEDADEDSIEGVPIARVAWFRRLRLWLRWFPRRMRGRFREMLAEAERERRQARAAAPVQGGWLARLKVRSMRWVAESIAEQRLLWHLRRQTDACLYYPDDLDHATALGLMRAQLGRDFDKHRFWLTIDALGFIASGIAFFVPGPNIIAYYFAFRLVGHYFSLRGARRGLSNVSWTAVKSEWLAELRRAIDLEPAVRERRVHEVATRLHLEHLASFFERTAVPLS
jgi:hypothetical protein